MKASPSSPEQSVGDRTERATAAVLAFTIVNMDAGYRLNRPHYHPWMMAATGRAMFRGRGFHTRQAATQWAKRRQPDGEKRTVLACYDSRCQPPMD